MQQVMIHPRRQIAVVVHPGMALQLLMLGLPGVEALLLAARREEVPLVARQITMEASNNSRNRNFPIWREMR